MLILSTIILGVHGLLLAILCGFGLHRLSMVYRWYRYRNVKKNLTPTEKFAQKPSITVQIPLYNERLVAERVIDAVAALQYPAGALQIQIVDDSTDETKDLVSERVRYHQQKGINIHHVRRDDREGYKAGALKQAMASATGEFIAIFDADFLPHPSLLEDTIDHFSDPKIGMVQFRWEHLNRKQSALTETQAMMLDSHFSLEQNVRHASDLFFNFNGTAGIWRTEAIVDAGHWSADTLTEDLDLSYRAQLRGWKMIYLNEQSCAGEIPANMNAFKSQQHRWVKGGIQVMLKILGTVWRSPFSIRHKIEATFHLSNNLAYLVMLIDTIFLLIPSLFIREYYGYNQRFMWLDIPIVIMASGGHLIYLIFGQVALGHSKLKALLNSPRLLLLGIQLAVNNARAAAEALLGQKSEFVRTPKSGDCNKEIKQKPRKALRLYNAVAPKGMFFELLFAIVYTLVLFWAFAHEIWFMLPFLLLLIVGFANNAIGAVFQQHAE